MNKVIVILYPIKYWFENQISTDMDICININQPSYIVAYISPRIECSNIHSIRDI